MGKKSDRSSVELIYMEPIFDGLALAFISSPEIRQQYYDNAKENSYPMGAQSNIANYISKINQADIDITKSSIARFYKNSDGSIEGDFALRMNGLPVYFDGRGKPILDSKGKPDQNGGGSLRLDSGKVYLSEVARNDLKQSRHDMFKTVKHSALANVFGHDNYEIHEVIEALEKYETASQAAAKEDKLEKFKEQVKHMSFDQLRNHLDIAKEKKPPTITGLLSRIEATGIQPLLLQAAIIDKDAISARRGRRVNGVSYSKALLGSWEYTQYDAKRHDVRDLERVIERIEAIGVNELMKHIGGRNPQRVINGYNFKGLLSRLEEIDGGYPQGSRVSDIIKRIERSDCQGLYDVAARLDLNVVSDRIEKLSREVKIHEESSFKALFEGIKSDFVQEMRGPDPTDDVKDVRELTYGFENGENLPFVTNAMHSSVMLRLNSIQQYATQDLMKVVRKEDGTTSHQFGAKLQTYDDLEGKKAAEKFGTTQTIYSPNIHDLEQLRKEYEEIFKRYQIDTHTIQTMDFPDWKIHQRQRQLNLELAEETNRIHKAITIAEGRHPYDVDTTIPVGVGKGIIFVVYLGASVAVPFTITSSTAANVGILVGVGTAEFIYRPEEHLYRLFYTDAELNPGEYRKDAFKTVQELYNVYKQFGLDGRYSDEYEAYRAKNLEPLEQELKTAEQVYKDRLITNLELVQLYAQDLKDKGDPAYKPSYDSILELDLEATAKRSITAIKNTLYAAEGPWEAVLGDAKTLDAEYANLVQKETAIRNVDAKIDVVNNRLQEIQAKNDQARALLAKSDNNHAIQWRNTIFFEGKMHEVMERIGMSEAVFADDVSRLSPEEILEKTEQLNKATGLGGLMTPQELHDATICFQQYARRYIPSYGAPGGRFVTYDEDGQKILIPEIGEKGSLLDRDENAQQYIDLTPSKFKRAIAEERSKNGETEEIRERAAAEYKEINSVIRKSEMSRFRRTILDSLETPEEKRVYKAWNTLLLSDDKEKVEEAWDIIQEIAKTRGPVDPSESIKLSKPVAPSAFEQNAAQEGNIER